MKHYSHSKVFSSLRINPETFDAHLLMNEYLLKALFAFCLLFASFLIPFAAYAFPPGTSIDSKATVSFSLSGSDLILESSPTGNTVTGIGNGSQTRMAIDRALNFNIVSNDTPGAVNSSNRMIVLAGQTNIISTFSLTNTGNATQDFILAAVDSEVSGEINIDSLPGSLRVFVESNTTAGYQLLEDTQTFVDDLLPTASQTIYVISDIPASANPDDLIVISLIAQVAEETYSVDTNDISGVILGDQSNQLSPTGVFETITVNGPDIPAPITPLDTPCNAANNHNAPCEFQTIFAEPAAADPEDISSTAVKGDSDLASNGQHSDSVALLVNQSPVVVSKSQLALSPEGAIPGSNLRYSLSINILCRTDIITDVIIRDNIPALTTFAPGSIRFNGSVPANTNFNTVGGIGFDATNNRVVANLGDQPAQITCLSPSLSITTHTLTFEVVID